MKRAIILGVIWLISAVGVLFSGWLTLGELSSGSCPAGGGCSQIFGIPTCAYGLVMYSLVFVLAFYGVNFAEEENPWSK